MVNMTYDEYSPLINTGDLIAIPIAHNILGKATQYFTRSTYTHTGIAIWLDNELFMAELNGGRNHLIPIIQLTNFHVYKCPDNLNDIYGSIRKWLSYIIEYGYSAFIAIGLLNWLRIKYFVHWKNILVCSGYCVAIYQTAGWQQCSRVISPGELTSMLNLKFKVEPIK